MRTIRWIILLAAAVVLPATAHAQFPGDVFFRNPSVSVPAGGTATMEVLLFSGAQVLGASHVSVVYDPTLAEVVALQPGTTAELVEGFVGVDDPGRASLVTLNGASATRPIGTESLAILQVRPLAGAGTVVRLSIVVHSLLRQDSAPLSGGRGFAGEILVVSGSGGGQASATSSLAGTAAPDRAPDDATAERALAFRRPGQVVDLLDFTARGGQISADPRRVIVADPTAPAEEPER